MQFRNNTPCSGILLASIYKVFNTAGQYHDHGGSHNGSWIYRVDNPLVELSEANRFLRKLILVWTSSITMPNMVEMGLCVSPGWGGGVQHSLSVTSEWQSLCQ